MDSQITDKRLTILVVSENETQIEDMKIHLQNTLTYPCQIWHCASAARSIGFFEMEVPVIDVVLLDLDLTNSEGTGELFRQMRDIAGKIPIIVFNARNDHRLALKAIEAGAADNIASGSRDPYNFKDTIEFSIARNNIAKEIDKRNTRNLTRIEELDATNVKKMKERHVTALQEAKTESECALREALEHGKNDLREADRHANVMLKESIEHGEKALKDAIAESVTALEKHEDENAARHREKDLTIHWMSGGYSA